MDKTKPKRKLSDIDFDRDGAHIALCHKEQSVANMADYALVIKGGELPRDLLPKMNTEQEKETLATEAKTEPAIVEKQSEVNPKIASGEVGVHNPVVKLTKKEKLMSVKDVAKEIAKDAAKEDVVKSIEVEQTVTTQVVEKSLFEAIQKEAQETKELLQKALADVAKFQQEKQEQVAKQRKSEVLAAVKDEAKADVLFKAVKDADDADFQAVVKALGDLVAAVDKSDLFVEKGAVVESQEDNLDHLSAVKKAVMAKLNKQ